ncbi:RidA family protein [Paracoccus actinidiae]|jgi:enamine deaminase RidA (YjgF/YER057c/UK114 family)|uniref:RidA family protein n=1 Tax=Paracoccus actinidiae TaxID=3064531 RepID=UPI0027D2BBD5|nr:RidA family protein [Paracoccus sp. M09]
MITAPVHGAPVPQGNYVPARRSGKLIVTAGMTPRIDGRLMSLGPIRNDAAVEGYREAVVLACSNALTAAQSMLRADEELEAILSMTVYIAAEPDFTGHSRLADFASAFLLQELGQVGVCSRTAVGVASLPGGAPVEIQLMAAVR